MPHPGRPIDLRSDTVTLPTPAMREAMAAAPVGDDQYGDDPSVNLLEERIAKLLGKERAVFMPSGTMTNQTALRVLARPGDEVVVGGEAHVLWHETGAAAFNAGVQIQAVGASGLFTAFGRERSGTVRVRACGFAMAQKIKHHKFTSIYE